ncbi:MAG TPA: hypothetical protein VHT97_03465 [Acidimicrobiales bacterium]|nr:hypothetical protein [Acidimicrobiales bacterium]
MDLSRLSRGERTVLLAGAFLLLDLLAFPWHRYSLVATLLLGLSSPTRTGLQSPDALQGTLAFLVAVGMVAQVVMTRFTNQKVNPLLLKLQPVAGMAVLALLAWKLAIDTSFLSVGCYLGLALGVAMAYGGLLIGRESGTLK